MNLTDLLALEKQITEGVCNVLKSRGGLAIPEFSDTKATRPNYEVKLQGVKVVGYFIDAVGIRKPSQWVGTLIIRTITVRFQNSDLHGEMLARSRACVFDWRTLFSPEHFPFLRIMHLEESGGGSGHQVDGGYDFTEQHHEITFELRPEHLPK